MHGCGMPTGPTFFLPGQRDQPWYVQLSNAIGLVLSGKAGLASSKTNPGSKNTTNSAANGGTRLGGRIVTEDALGDVAIRNAMRVKPEPGVFDVIGHGTPSSVSGMSPSQLASAIRARPGWGGQDIRLLSCSTGCPTGNFAQGLANELGVVVRAPTTDLFVSSRGGITFESGGGWRIFSPGG